jgi:exonuclease VII small subunit
VATNLANSADVASQVSAAEACLGELEGLQLSLSLGNAPLDEVIQAYRQAVAKVSFLTDVPVP